MACPYNAGPTIRPDHTPGRFGFNFQDQHAAAADRPSATAHVKAINMSWSKDERGGGPRGYHHGNLKEALLRAALELIAQKGPAGFTFAEAARWAGVSPAAPYRHFRDRDELLANVALRGFERFARPNAGEKTAEATMTHMKEATITHRKAGKGQQEYLVAPSQQNKQQLQINQQNSPLQKGTLGGSTGPTKPPLPTTGGRRQ
jgi:hypothetical protein